MNMIRKGRFQEKPVSRIKDFKINPAFSIEFLEYKSVLSELGKSYKVFGDYLVVGRENLDAEWRVYVSVIPAEMKDMLMVISGIVFDFEVGYKVVKNQFIHYNMNAGNMGQHLSCKVITFYPRDVSEAAVLIDKLRDVTKKFRGPVIQSAVQVSKNIYVENIDSERSFRKKDFPFRIEIEYRKRNLRLHLLKRGYLALDWFKMNPRGFVIKAIFVKKLDWCLLKYGAPYGAMDHCGRSVREMLEWQRRVLTELHLNDVPVPKVFEYWEEGDETYLTMEFFEGEMLRDAIRRILKDGSWRGLDVLAKRTILNVCLQVVEIVEKMHMAGYIHRDLTCYNFIIDKSGKMKVVDLELSYSVLTNEPDPHFIMGTDGFVAPEQLKYAFPNFPEDVYSLGALLWFIFTGELPKGERPQLLGQIKEDSNHLIGDNAIVDVIKGCLEENPSGRVSVDSLKNSLIDCLKSLDYVS